MVVSQDRGAIQTPATLLSTGAEFRVGGGSVSRGRCLVHSLVPGGGDREGVSTGSLQQAPRAVSLLT